MPCIHKGKRKPLLILGLVGMALFAAGDVLLRSLADDGETILLMMKPPIADMPMGRLYLTLLSGMIVAPLMYLGLSAMDSWLRGRLGERKGRIYRCFQVGAIIATLSFFAAHSVCAVLGMGAMLLAVAHACGKETFAASLAPASRFRDRGAKLDSSYDRTGGFPLISRAM